MFCLGPPACDEAIRGPRPPVRVSGVMAVQHGDGVYLECGGCGLGVRAGVGQSIPIAVLDAFTRTHAACDEPRRPERRKA